MKKTRNHRRIDNFYQLPNKYVDLASLRCRFFHLDAKTVYNSSFLLVYMTFLFLIVGKSGEPLYELATSGHHTDDEQHLNQFIAHSALDLVELAAWNTNTTALRCVDSFQKKSVSAFLTPGNVKFLLLHDGRNEDSIRVFFNEVHELYIKVSLLCQCNALD